MSCKIGGKDKLGHGVLDDLNLAYVSMFQKLMSRPLT